MQLHTLEARNPQEIDRAFAAMTRERADALLMLAEGVFTNQLRQIAELATQRRLPSIYGVTEYAEAGGLMVYTANFLDLERRAATYVDKILKGPSPATCRWSSRRSSSWSSTSRPPRPWGSLSPRGSSSRRIR